MCVVDVVAPEHLKSDPVVLAFQQYSTTMSSDNRQQKVNVKFSIVDDYKTQVWSGFWTGVLFSFNFDSF